VIKDGGKHKTLELNNSPAACGSEKPKQNERKKIAKSRKSERERSESIP